MISEYSGRYIPTREVIIQGRTLKYNEQDKPGRMQQDIRQAAEWANWNWDDVVSTHVNFNPDEPNAWIFWTAVLVVRIE
jgi:hypothetical protein